MSSPVLRSAALAAAALAACSFFAAGASAQQAVTSFENNPPNGEYKFASWTPKTLAELAKGNQQNDRVEVVGHLFLPKGQDKVPAVILQHGSGGIYRAMTDYWPKQFNAAGIAVFSLDTFNPRGVKSTADDQTLVPPSADLADVFAALRLLASHPRIDGKRIALMGFSRGGAAAWRANVERIIAWQKLPDGLRFAAHIPVYAGGCVGTLRIAARPGAFGKAPMLWLHGDADDYTAIGPCRDYADAIAKTGTPVEFVAIKGAGHKFDSDDTRKIKAADVVRALPDCPLEFDMEAFSFVDRTNGQRLAFDAAQAIGKKCLARGATVQGNATARDTAAKAAVAFLRKVFALGS
jgi:dienelactone hydrolase